MSRRIRSNGKDEQALSALFTFIPPEGTEIIQHNE